MNINIFGSTGIIGKKSLDIIHKYFPSIKVNLLCANNNVDILIKQIDKFQPTYVYLDNNKKLSKLAKSNLKKN